MMLEIEKYAFILSRSPNGAQQGWDPSRGMPPLIFRLRKWKNIKTNIHTLHASTFLNFKGFLTNNWQFVLQKQKTPLMQGFSSIKVRRGRDSNPRRGYKPLTHLAGERLQPLGHLSVN